MIDGVKIKKLVVHSDERGRLMELLRKDDDIFQEFGQVYMTTNYPGVVKAWHLHKKQTDFVCCVKGMIKVALFDPRKNSRTFSEINEFFIGEHNPFLIVIPKNIYHGWKCISEKESITINTPTKTYDRKIPDEKRLPFDTKKIPYDWDIKIE